MSAKTLKKLAVPTNGSLLHNITILNNFETIDYKLILKLRIIVNHQNRIAQIIDGVRYILHALFCFQLLYRAIPLNNENILSK